MNQSINTDSKNIKEPQQKYRLGNDDEDSEESEEFLETPICESTFSSANDETFQQLKPRPYEVVHTTASDSNDKDTKHGRRDDCPNLNGPVEERLKGDERFVSESSVVEFIRRTCRFGDDKQRGQMAVSKTKRSAKTPTVGNEGYINYNLDNSSDDYEADENQSIVHDKAERSLFDFLKQKLLHGVEHENETTPITQHSKNSHLFSSDLDRSLDDSKTDKVDCLTGKKSESSLFQFLKQTFIPSATEEHEKEKLSNCNDSMASHTKPMRMGNGYSETSKLDFLKQKLKWSDGEANRDGEANITAKLLEKNQRIEMSKQRRYTSLSLEDSRLRIHDKRRYINKNTVPQRNKCVKYPNLERQSVPYDYCPKGNWANKISLDSSKDKSSIYKRVSAFGILPNASKPVKETKASQRRHTSPNLERSLNKKESFGEHNVHVGVKKMRNTCSLGERALNHETGEEKELSAGGTVITALQNVKRYFLPRHRRYLRTSRRKASVEVYRRQDLRRHTSFNLGRNKTTDTDTEVDTAVQRSVFDIVKDKLTGARIGKGDVVSEKVEKDLAKRPKLFDRMSREAYFRAKYFD